jgi:hypothetical protein
MDFIPDIGTTGTNDGFEGRAVFVGGERDLLDGDLGELDLRGRVAVTAEPVREAAVDTLLRRGAVGMVHLVADPAVFRLYVQSRGATRLQHRDTSIASSFFPRLPSLIVGPRVTSALIDGMALAPNDRLFPQPLAWDVRADIGSVNKPVDDENVVCVLPGTDRAARDTAIALSAHYDHLGISTPDDAGDSIYNGFSDNAAGVGMLLAIAEALGHPGGRRPRHSVLFLFFTGEERGLLGSDAYVAAPAWPLDRTLALINLDAGAPPAAPTSWRLAGVDSTGLGAVAARVAERRQWQVVTSEARANQSSWSPARSRMKGCPKTVPPRCAPGGIDTISRPTTGSRTFPSRGFSVMRRSRSTLSSKPTRPWHGNGLARSPNPCLRLTYPTLSCRQWVASPASGPYHFASNSLAHQQRRVVDATMCDEAGRAEPRVTSESRP